MKKIIRMIDSALACVIIVIFTFVIYGNAMLPDEITVYNSGSAVFSHAYVVDGASDSNVAYQSASSVGNSNSVFKLFAVIPVKETTVTKKSTVSVAVSGESFGIKLYTDGVIVVGTRDIENDGKTVNPTEESGIQVGDIIISINNVNVYSSDEVENILNDNNGDAYKIKINRNGKYKTYTLKPVYVASEGCYKAGMWVRDSTAGIGTITFYNPENNMLAALGHPVTDVDTNEIMPILSGEAVKATVTKVYKSTNGEAGSLCCDFSSDIIGSLTENSDYGIYGTYNESTILTNFYEVASAQEIEKGFAQIITTVDDEGPKVYTVEITKIMYNGSDEQKNMVIKITDEDLIEKTGGIVQGMSGSPIIQNGKLVGALTHVIIDNPKKGYAIFAERMAEESNCVK